MSNEVTNNSKPASLNIKKNQNQLNCQSSYHSPMNIGIGPSWHRIIKFMVLLLHVIWAIFSW